MNKNDLYRSFSHVDDKDLERSETQKSNAILKWGILAACLCIVAGAAVILFRGPQTPGGGVEAGGADAGHYSVAVFPGTESEENVATADVASLTEAELANYDLARYLPDPLPEGFHFGRGSVYSTCMKDGTRYTMLRIEYMEGVIPEQQYAEDGGALAPDPNAMGALFTVCVTNFQPQIDRPIYDSPEDITEEMFADGWGVCIRFGDCYVQVFPELADPATVLEAVKNLG